MSILTASRNEMGFCPGCSHGSVLEQLAAAIARLGLAPEQVCLVSDIGCIGMADRYFTTHTFHGLHGRSITYAEGIKRVRPELLVVVLIGDGGCGIGTGHLVHAARRGVGIKVVVCNNFNFGMTGGQHSPTTPAAGLTATTPGGATDPAFDICQTVAVNGAAYVARHPVIDETCVEHIEQALRAPGFALLDLWELCVAYYVPSNKLTRPGLYELSQALRMPFGVLRNDPAPPAAAQPVKAQAGRTKEAPPALPLTWPRKRSEICVAGSAGQRIRSAVGALGEIAVAGGLHAAQQDDFPITVRKGHSISNLILSTDTIRYGGVDDPDLVLILSPDGEKRFGGLGALRPECRVVADEGLALAPTPATVQRIKLREFERAAGRTSAALAVLAAAVVERGWLDGPTLVRAAQTNLAGKYRDENVRAIAAGLALAAG